MPILTFLIFPVPKTNQNGASLSHFQGEGDRPLLKIFQNGSSHILNLGHKFVAIFCVVRKEKVPPQQGREGGCGLVSMAAWVAVALLAVLPPAHGLRLTHGNAPASQVAFVNAGGMGHLRRETGVRVAGCALRRRRGGVLTMGMSLAEGVRSSASPSVEEEKSLVP